MSRYAGTHDATKYPDMAPAAFTFTDVTGQAISTVVASDEITITSVACPIGVQVSGGEYQIDGGSWTSSDGTIALNSVAKVRVTTSASQGTAVSAILIAGGVRDTFTATTATTPVNTVPPAITGTEEDGETLTCGNGTWSNVPTSYTYRWYTSPSTATAITTATYLLGPTDVATTLFCRVTAINAVGSAMEPSNTTGAIAP